MRTKLDLCLSALLIAACGTAVAQSPPASKPLAEIVLPAGPAGSKDCSPMQSVPQPAPTAPEGTTTGQSPEPLGDKLAKSDGVLCPPIEIDPAIRAPTPDAGNTPVIPPPGSPGGDPTLRPK